MKRFKIIVVSMMFFLLIGCGKKSIPEVAIGYCYLNIYDDNIDIISPDGSLYKCNIGYQDDFDYDNGNIYYIGEDSFFKANISKQEVYPLLDENEYKNAWDSYGCAGPIISLGDSGKVAVQFFDKKSEHSSIYIIDNGRMEYLCEVDGKGINCNNNINMNRVAFSADKSGENLFIKQNDELKKYNVQNKTGTTLISDFKYDIFDVDGSGDKVAYIYKNNIFLYEISSGNETQIGEMEFPVGKISISNDGNWIMVMDVTAPKGFLADLYPPSPIYNLYIYDCVNHNMNKMLEGSIGTEFGGFDFAE